METVDDELRAERMANELLAADVGGVVLRYALAILQEVSARRLERLAVAMDGNGDSVEAARDRCAAAMIHVEYRMAREELFRFLTEHPAPANGAAPPLADVAAVGQTGDGRDYSDD